MATVDYKNLAADILKNVGGESNVISVVHCATRLRFKLVDPSRADKGIVGQLPGVITTIESAGQFQVVIGNNVSQVYEGIGEISNLVSDEANTAVPGGGTKEGLLARAVDLVTGIFVPMLGALAAVGILKGLLLICLAAGWLSHTSTTYQILFAASDGLFIFLPLVLAVSSAKKFKANLSTSMALGAALIYTSLQNVSLVSDSGKPFSGTLSAFAMAGNHVTFFGIPVIVPPYTSTVIPIILAVYVLSKLEKLLNKFVHEAVRGIVVPLICIVIMVPLTLMTIGPVCISLSVMIAKGLLAVYSLSPAVFGAVMGGIFQILVVFGIHWGLVPIMFNNFTTQGWDLISAPAFTAVFGQVGAAFGVFLRSRNPRFKALAGSTTVTGMFGITEPIIYGVTLPLKRPFIIGVISGAIGGVFIGAFHVRLYAMAMPSLLSFPTGFGDPKGFGSTFIWLVIGTVVSFICATVGTFFFGFSKKALAEDRAAGAAAKAAHQAKVSDAVITAPVAGTLVALDQINDKVFASGVMGPGVGIKPVDGKILAPFDAVVVVALEAGHAVGLKGDNGVEILIHAGIDTVQLQGKHFSAHVVRGERVTAGQLLMEADFPAIVAEGYDDTCVLVVANAEDFAAVEPATEGEVDQSTTILTVRR